jgi:hypothetical protein
MKKTNIIIIGIILIVCSQIVLGALTDNLEIYYTFNDSTNQGDDILGSVNDGVVTNNIVGTGKNNNSINFTGTGYMVVNDTANNSPISAMSVNLWYKASDMAGAYKFFTKDVNFAGNGAYQFGMGGAGNGKARFLISTTGSYDSAKDLTANTTLNADTWYMLTAVYDGSNLLIYVNSVLDGQKAVTGNIHDSTAVVNFFMENIATNRIKGGVDELGFWKDKALSPAEITQLYNGGTGLFYPFGETPPPTGANFSIDFISQKPSDLTATSLFSTNILNVTYNVSNITGLRYTYLNYTITTAPQRCVFFLNGTCYQQGNTFIRKNSNTNNLSSLQDYILNDNMIYPGTYNLNETVVERTVHDIKNLAGSNNYLIIPLKNVSNATSYNQFELYINTTGTAEIFYCNSSYSTGNPTIADTCILISSFSSGSFNHTHNQSKHNVFALPINTTTGRVGSVRVSNLSQFVIRNAEYIGSTNTSCGAKYSTNSGGAYSDLSYCPDAHLHQYVGNEYLNYTACMFNGNLTCSSFRVDLIDPVYLPPTAPEITNPINNSQVVGEWLNITYQSSIPSTNTSTIKLYNISLLNSDLSFNRTLKSNNSLNLSYYWNTYLSQLSTGIYYIRVLVVDSNNNTNYDISESINITTNSKINISVKDYLSNALVDTYSINITDLVTGIKRNDSTTTNYTTFDVVKGRSYNVTVDALGYSYASASFTIPFNISKTINDTATYTTSLTAPQSFIQSNLASYVNPKVISETVLMKADASTTAICYVNYTYSDGTVKNSSVESTTSTSYVSKSFTNPEPTKNVVLAELWCYKSGSSGLSVTNHTISIVYDSTYYDAVVYAYTQNSVSIYIYDEITLLLVDNQNITVQFIADSSITRVTDNGTLYVDNLTSGVWSVRFSGDNYTTKTYTITVNNKSTQTLNAYLTSTSNLVVFETTDITSGVPIENASFTMEKLINGSYVVTESKFTDIIGDSQFAYVPYTKYKFTVAKEGYNTKVFYLDPIIFATYTISLTPLATPSNPLDFDQVTVVYYPKFFYNNRANNFTFLISSPTGVLTNYGFNISYPGGSNATSGVNANGQTFVFFFNITGANTFDRLNLTFNYSSTLSGIKTFRTSFEILGTTGIGNNTMIQLKDNTYGLGLMERAFITMIIVVIISGLAYSLIGVGGALLLGLIIHGMAVFFGFMPIGSIVISLLVGFLMILANSTIGGRQ